MNVIILLVVKIGNGVIILVGVVVFDNIFDYVIVGGVFVRIIKFKYSLEIIEELNKICWWNWFEEKIRLNVNDFYLLIDIFIKKYLQMYICFLINEFFKDGFLYGGIGSFIKIFVVVLVKKGIKVFVVGINYIVNYEIEIINGVKVYCLKSSKIKGLLWCFNFKEINKKIKEIYNQDFIIIIEFLEFGFVFIIKIKDIKYII